MAFFHSARWRVRLAQVAEVSVEHSQVVVHRVICAADCGAIINPNQAEAQLEGGILFGLTAALYGEITLNRGQVEQSNFNDYQMLTMADAPDVEVHLIQGSDAPGGIGEVGVPPIAPTVANAVSSIIGRPIRALPISKQLRS